MKLTRYGLGIILCGVLLSAPAAWSQSTDKPPAAPSKSTEQKKTGEAVPSGVKLVTQMPAPAAATPYRFPKAVTRTLSNGVRVFVISDSRQPLVAVRLVLMSAGSRNDPAGKPGIANLAADLLTQGTATRSAEQIAEAIDFVGGSLNAGAGKDDTRLTVRVVKKDFALGMDLLSDILLHPAFKKEEVDRRRQQALSGLQVQYSDPGYIAGAMLSRLLYGQNPYGLPGNGTPDSLRAIERDDLIHFRDDHYTPDQALLAFAGDIAPDAAFAAAEKYLGAAVWPKRDVAAQTSPAPAPVQGLRVFLVDKPDANQTQIRVGRLGIPRNNPDYIPLLVTNRIFGGGFNSRLSTEVRQKKGLTYGAYSSFNSYQQAGDFSASTFTRTEATVEATKLVVDLIGKMSTGGLDPKELDFARDYLAGVFPIQSETAENVASSTLTVVQFNLPADYNDVYQQKIMVVDPAKVKEIAGRYFDSNNLVLVLVGNVKAFGEALHKDFPQAKFEELPFDQVDLLTPDLRKPKVTGVAATPESLERGKALLTAAAEAAGGARLAKIESVEFKGQGEFITPQGTFPVETSVVVAYPDHIRAEITLPMAAIKTGFDGKSSWLQSPQGTMDLPPALNAENLRTIALTAGWGLFQQALEGKSEVKFIGEEEVEGQKLLAAEWTSPAGPTKLYFDPATRMLVGARFKQTGLQGPAEVLDLWSDFKAVEGLQFPYKHTTYRDGAKSGSVTASSVQVNTKPDPTVFSKPK
ncbi:MAG: insulinase family protein [Acidobacteriia bacterium]|nr:insulinase family protein [Terriglobia bacterium]